MTKLQMMVSRVIAHEAGHFFNYEGPNGYYHADCTGGAIMCDQRGGIDFEKLEAARRRLGITGEGEGWPKAYNDPAFSRRVLGLDDG